mmetsp:Transcript_5072/g.5697  ORF Transcript_5072/g.5697 Transcript_5072/m.5697 type:complete len:116 (+) Transcript_5072:138-485(+)
MAEQVDDIDDIEECEEVPVIPTNSGLKRPDKVIVHLKHVGNAPILKKQKIRVSGKDRFLKLIDYLQKATSATNGLFIYINSAFSPTPDQIIGDIYESFKIGEELIVNYALTEAWG